jgi:hypothetical protein
MPLRYRNFQKLSVSFGARGLKLVEREFRDTYLDIGDRPECNFGVVSNAAHTLVCNSFWLESTICCNSRKSRGTDRQHFTKT